MTNFAAELTHYWNNGVRFNETADDIKKFMRTSRVGMSSVGGKKAKGELYIALTEYRSEVVKTKKQNTVNGYKSYNVEGKLLAQGEAY